MRVHGHSSGPDPQATRFAARPPFCKETEMIVASDAAPTQIAVSYRQSKTDAVRLVRTL